MENHATGVKRGKPLYPGNLNQSFLKKNDIVFGGNNFLRYICIKLIDISWRKLMKNLSEEGGLTMC